MSQGSHLRTRGYAVAQVGWEVTIGVTVHDGMSDLRPNGTGGGHLRCELRARFGTIFHQESINDSELGGTVKFKFKGGYKTPRNSHETTLIHLRFEKLRRAQDVERQAIFELQSLQKTTNISNRMMTTKRSVGFVESTTNEAL